MTMTEERINLTASRWARLGVMFGSAPADGAIDVERLLLDTAQCASANTRLLVMAVAWLARHGEVVAKHRLAALVARELDAAYHPVMGLLLDLARNADKANKSRFDLAIRRCIESDTANQGRPLADVECANPFLRKLAQTRASAVSRKWGRWYEEFEIKQTALRPVAWVIQHNPGLYERALSGGELPASILAECESTEGRAGSEAELAHRCGASRPAVRAALRSLERIGRIQISRIGRSHAVELVGV